MILQQCPGCGSRGNLDGSGFITLPDGQVICSYCAAVLGRVPIGSVRVAVGKVLAIIADLNGYFEQYATIPGTIGKVRRANRSIGTYGGSIPMLLLRLDALYSNIGTELDVERIAVLFAKAASVAADLWKQDKDILAILQEFDLKPAVRISMLVERSFVALGEALIEKEPRLKAQVGFIISGQPW